jgi:hypothetical protein
VTPRKLINVNKHSDDEKLINKNLSEENGEVEMLIENLAPIKRQKNEC